MSFSVQDILRITQGRFENSEELGQRAGQIQVIRPAPLAESKNSDLAFFFSRAFENELATARPGVLITGTAFAGPLKAAGLPLWKNSAVVSCQDPYFSMAVLSREFAQKMSSVAHVPAAEAQNAQREETVIHPTAWVDPSAELGPGVKVGPHCVIEAGVRIGSRTVLYPGCVIGPECQVGQDCTLFSHVTLYEWTVLGNRVRLHSGCVLGSDGFGYAPERKDRQVLGHQKIYHLGRVLVGDDVEIGANSCVDRGTIGETRIGKNSKLDNLVHIGHNAQLGEGAIICGGTCLAGNASVGSFAYIGGLTGVGNHVHVGSGASVGALTMVTKDVPEKGTAVGNPQRTHQEHFRAHALLGRLLSERRNK